MHMYSLSGGRIMNTEGNLRSSSDWEYNGAIRRQAGRTGAQFNTFVEISTDFSTEFLVLQGVPHDYKNSVEKSVEISTKLLN